MHKTQVIDEILRAELYRAAIFETDPKTLRLRIHKAESAVILRGGELVAVSNDTSEEAAAQDDALYALRALRSCLRFKTRESEVSSG